MEKIPILMREPRMWDYNKMAYAINNIIDRLEKKVDMQSIQLTKSVKDYSFFKWEEVELPYNTNCIIRNAEELNELLWKYNFDSITSWALTDMINKWIIVNLWISVNEEVTEKDNKQEELIKTIESKPIEEVIKEVKIENKKVKKQKQKKEKSKWWNVKTKK